MHKQEETLSKPSVDSTEQLFSSGKEGLAILEQIEEPPTPEKSNRRKRINKEASFDAPKKGALKAATGLTLENVKKMREMCNDDNWTGMYLYYYGLTGNEQAFLQAQISSFSGFIGAIAECGNQAVQAAYPLQYHPQGILAFSKEIAVDFVTKVEQDLNKGKEGKGGLFTEKEMKYFAQEKWAEKGIEHLFLAKLYPLNMKILWEDLKRNPEMMKKVVYASGLFSLHKNPFTLAKDIFKSFPEGTQTSVECGAEIAFDKLLEKLHGGTTKYGKEIEDFFDKEKYFWRSNKIKGEYLSCIVQRVAPGHNKVVYIEKSDYAARLHRIELRLWKSQSQGEKSEQKRLMATEEKNVYLAYVDDTGESKDNKKIKGDIISSGVLPAPGKPKLIFFRIISATEDTNKEKHAITIYSGADAKDKFSAAEQLAEAVNNFGEKFKGVPVELEFGIGGKKKFPNEYEEIVEKEGQYCNTFIFLALKSMGLKETDILKAIKTDSAAVFIKILQDPKRGFGFTEPLSASWFSENRFGKKYNEPFQSKNLSKGKEKEKEKEEEYDKEVCQLSEKKLSSAFFDKPAKLSKLRPSFFSSQLNEERLYELLVNIQQELRDFRQEYKENLESIAEERKQLREEKARNKERPSFFSPQPKSFCGLSPTFVLGSCASLTTVLGLLFVLFIYLYYEEKVVPLETPSCSCPSPLSYFGYQ